MGAVKHSVSRFSDHFWGPFWAKEAARRGANLESLPETAADDKTANRHKILWKLLNDKRFRSRRRPTCIASWRKLDRWKDIQGERRTQKRITLPGQVRPSEAFVASSEWHANQVSCKFLAEWRLYFKLGSEERDGAIN